MGVGLPFGEMVGLIIRWALASLVAACVLSPLLIGGLIALALAWAALSRLLGAN